MPNSSSASAATSQANEPEEELQYTDMVKIIREKLTTKYSGKLTDSSEIKYLIDICKKFDTYADELKEQLGAELYYVYQLVDADVDLFRPSDRKTGPLIMKTLSVIEDEVGKTIKLAIDTHVTRLKKEKKLLIKKSIINETKNFVIQIDELFELVIVAKKMSKKKGGSTVLVSLLRDLVEAHQKQGRVIETYEQNNAVDFTEESESDDDSSGKEGDKTAGE